MNDREKARIESLKSKCLNKLENMQEDAKKYRMARLEADRILWQMIAPFIERSEKLTGWITTGLAATVALAIGNASSLKENFPRADVTLGVWLLAASVFLYVLQRLIGDANLAQHEASREIEKSSSKLAGTRPSLDELAEISARLINAHPWPWRNAAERSVLRAFDGDWDYGSRRAMRLTMHTSLVLILGNFLLSSAALLALTGYF